MDIYMIQKARRSIRKFIDKEIPYEMLEKFVDYARLSASAKNTQAVRYMIITDANIANKIFPHTHWAGYLKGEHSPTYNERPRAYILLMTDNEISKESKYDIGAASQAILLMAHSEGIGTCWLRAIDREKIIKICDISDRYTLDTAIAFGYPAEKPVIEDAKNNNIKYYKDKENTLHVPKRTLEDVLIK